MPVLMRKIKKNKLRMAAERIHIQLCNACPIYIRTVKVVVTRILETQEPQALTLPINMHTEPMCGGLSNLKAHGKKGLQILAGARFTFCEVL